MADQIDSSDIPSLKEKRQSVSDGFKNNTGTNQPSLWNRLTGKTPNPTPDESLDAMQRRQVGGQK